MNLKFEFSHRKETTFKIYKIQSRTFNNLLNSWKQEKHETIGFSFFLFLNFRYSLGYSGEGVTYIIRKLHKLFYEQSIRNGEFGSHCFSEIWCLDSEDKQNPGNFSAFHGSYHRFASSQMYCNIFPHEKQKPLICETIHIAFWYRKLKRLKIVCSVRKMIQWNKKYLNFISPYDVFSLHSWRVIESTPSHII